jgi:FkbM family methyltransferase
MITIIRIYAHLHEFFHKYTGCNIRGLGLLYRFIKKDMILKVRGKSLYLNHNIADNYGRLVNDKFNEPETHLFIDSLLNRTSSEDIHFVDIGANIGEFILDYFDRKKVKHITAFEPQIEQIKALKKTIELNSMFNVTLIEKCVSKNTDLINFNLPGRNSTGSGITKSQHDSISLKPTTIDTEFNSDTIDNYIFLIDTEGAELDILKGGSDFIKNKFPILIFEYNYVTRRSFKIDEVKQYLGDMYEIYRLRKDGMLDLDYSKTWNLVAIPKFHKYKNLEELIIC